MSRFTFDFYLRDLKLCILTLICNLFRDLKKDNCESIVLKRREILFYFIKI